MRRSLAVLMAACLLSGAAIGTADAAKKKKSKKKPPATFEAKGSLVTANPTDFVAGTSFTRQEFLATCAVPASQGLDGYVIELPEKFHELSASVLIQGADALGLYDLDLFFFSEDCSARGEQSSSDADELGFFPPDTKYIFVSAFLGGGITFDVKVTEQR